jgi:tetratricopeptide (TPR) repeat protein
MICPYCVEDVPAGSTRHSECPVAKEKNFPLLYRKYHGGKEETEPVVLSVLGFSGHGKTVFLCALFHYLDRCLPKVWPGFVNQVLDQDSLSNLSVHRKKLEAKKVPDRTGQSFPRPGIFRLSDMPCGPVDDRVPFLEDTTLLVYDPPGEALEAASKIVEFARFVKRSRCVLFLVDLWSLHPSIASEMERLLETYVLSMPLMEIEKRSQHLIVVYTKADDVKVSVPQFATLLKENPEYEAYLSEQLPEMMGNPREHLRQLDEISHLLEDFTRTKLGAQKFINLASKWFASVSYTAVSSLGAAPEKAVTETGGEATLAVEMSPRGVADPLLYVLSKSERVRHLPPAWWRKLLTKAGIIGLSAGALLLIAVIYFALFYNADFRRAAACAELGDYSCAVQNYSKAIANYPKYAAAYTGRGWAFLEQERYEDALADCNQALQLNADLVEAMVCRGRANSLKGDYPSGFTDCNKAVELKPAYAEAYECRGFIYTHQGQFEKAIRDYNQGLEQKVSARAYFGRAIANAESGNDANAIKDQQTATKLAPGFIDVIKREHARAYEHRGRGAMGRGAHDDAVQLFSRAIALQADLVKALEGRGQAYFSLQKYELGAADFTTVIGLRPDDAAAYLSRGDAYAATGNHQEAISDYSEAAKRNGGSPEAFFKRAQVYAGLQRFDEAIFDYSEVIRVDGRLDAYFNRGNVYLARGDYRLPSSGKKVAYEDYAKAVADFDRVSNERTDDADPVFREGKANARRESYDDAIENYEEAISRDSNLEKKEDADYSYAFYRRGRDYRTKFDANKDASDCRENYQNALRDYEKALKLYPKNRLAEREIRYLEEKLTERCP